MVDMDHTALNRMRNRERHGPAAGCRHGNALRAKHGRVQAIEGNRGSHCFLTRGFAIEADAI